MIGGVPDGWEVKPLSELASRIMVGIASAATFAYRPVGVPMFRNQNIKEGRLDDSDLLFLNPRYEVRYRNKRLHAGDLLTARTGYPGTTALVPPQYREAQSFTTLITRPDPNTVDSAYLCYFINSSVGKAFVEQSQIGGAQKNLNAGSLRRMPVWLPTKREQKAITAALSDMDELITAFESQIAKKRAVKQGMMQELLTGRTRLPGFDGVWEAAQFKDVAAPTRETTIPQSIEGRVVELEHIDQGTGRLLGDQDAGKSVSLKTRFRAGDVLFGKLRSYLRKYWLAEHDGYCSTEIWALRARGGVNSAWVRYLVEQDAFIEAASTAHGTHMPRADWSVVSRFEVRVPEASEQAALAQVLTDADGEVRALERRLEATRAIKQGMMQELLTGRTRLVVKEDAA